MTVTQKSIEQLSIDTIRTLAIDSIEKAKSGHPGMPMGAAQWVTNCSRKI